MKQLFIISIMILCITGCEKEPLTTGNTTPTSPITPPPVNTINKAPFVSTGNDIFIVAPKDTLNLSGSAWDENNNIEKYAWKQVSGPSTAFIATPDSLITNVRNLRKGNYKFELIVTDKEGLTGKDTVYVTVLETGTGTNEIFLDNLNITCPWYCFVEIENLNSLNPDNMFFRIFLKNRQDTSWIEIKHVNNGGTGDKYIYDIYKNNLWIYAANEQMVDVKISY